MIIRGAKMTLGYGAREFRKPENDVSRFHQPLVTTGDVEGGRKRSHLRAVRIIALTSEIVAWSFLWHCRSFPYIKAFLIRVPD
jgi:hypothetical protein